jgi:pimeloyl-ACP methyl ester carboxylesterase
VIPVPGGQLSVEDEGAGEPVLLLHAGVTDRRVWDMTVPPLVEAGYRAIRYDARGLGRSPAGTEPYSLVADAQAVLDALEVPAAHFVGLSQGAATSVDVAIAAPARVRTLTLVAPGLSGYEWPRLPGYERRVEVADTGDERAFALELVKLWAPLSGTGDDAAKRIILDQAASFLSDDGEIEEPSAIERLGGIAAPTLVVLGDSDLDPITDIGHLLAERIPGARLVVLDGADHILPLRVPEKLHALLVEHLTR